MLRIFVPTVLKLEKRTVLTIMILRTLLKPSIALSTTLPALRR